MTEPGKRKPNHAANRKHTPGEHTQANTKKSTGEKKTETNTITIENQKKVSGYNRDPQKTTKNPQKKSRDKRRYYRISNKVVRK